MEKLLLSRTFVRNEDEEKEGVVGRDTHGKKPVETRYKGSSARIVCPTWGNEEREKDSWLKREKVEESPPLEKTRY